MPVAQPALAIRPIEIIWHIGDDQKQQGIMSVAQHPTDPSLIATAGCDNSVRIWRLRTRQSYDTARRDASSPSSVAADGHCPSSTNNEDDGSGSSSNANTFLVRDVVARAFLNESSSSGGSSSGSDAREEDMKAMSSAFELVACVDVPAVCQTVRWSPHGVLLAGACANADIHLWHQEYIPSPSSASVQDTAAATSPSSDIVPSSLQSYHQLNTTISSGTDKKKKVNNSSDELKWVDYKRLRGHTSDVTDLCFSPDSNYILSGDTDGNVLVYSIQRGQVLHTIKEAHVNSCQGVLWDPMNRFCCSFGADQTLRFYECQESKRHNMMTLALNERHTVCRVEKSLIFKGERAGGFFRRMSWSPDGALLAVPYGWNGRLDARSANKVGSTSTSTDKADKEKAADEEEDDELLGRDFGNCFYIFSRGDNFNKPFLCQSIEGAGNVCGVAFCPVVFPAPPRSSTTTTTADCSAAATSIDPPMGWGPSEYRYAIAAWTASSVYIYVSCDDSDVVVSSSNTDNTAVTDSEEGSKKPRSSSSSFTTIGGRRFAAFLDCHYDKITDVAWNHDGTMLFVSSLDFYVSVITLNASAGGSLEFKVHRKEQQQQQHNSTSPCSTKATTIPRLVASASSGVNAVVATSTTPSLSQEQQNGHQDNKENIPVSAPAAAQKIEASIFMKALARSILPIKENCRKAELAVLEHIVRKTSGIFGTDKSAGGASKLKVVKKSKKRDRNGDDKKSSSNNNKSQNTSEAAPQVMATADDLMNIFGDDDEKETQNNNVDAETAAAAVPPAQS